MLSPTGRVTLSSSRSPLTIQQRNRFGRSGIDFFSQYTEYRGRLLMPEIENFEPSDNYFDDARNAYQLLLHGAGQTVYWEKGPVEVYDTRQDPATRVITHNGGGKIKLTEGFALRIFHGRCKEVI